jgi:hypothetical protein
MADHDMKIEIPEDILNKTIRCENEFECLSEGWKPCGTVIRSIEAKLLYLDADLITARFCHYRVLYGGGSYCTCPTAIEIFKRYKTFLRQDRP